MALANLLNCYFNNFQLLASERPTAEGQWEFRMGFGLNQRDWQHKLVYRNCQVDQANVCGKRIKGTPRCCAEVWVIRKQQYPYLTDWLTAWRTGAYRSAKPTTSLDLRCLRAQEQWTSLFRAIVIAASIYIYLWRGLIAQTIVVIVANTRCYCLRFVLLCMCASLVVWLFMCGRTVGGNAAIYYAISVPHSIRSDVESTPGRQLPSYIIQLVHK